MSYESLSRRLGRLERLLADQPRGHVDRFTFSMGVERLFEGTEVPEGARIVTDFFFDFGPVENWREPGCTFWSGYERERVTFDPDDQGRFLPASEDAIGQAILAQAEAGGRILHGATMAEPPPPAAPEPAKEDASTPEANAGRAPFPIADDVLELYRPVDKDKLAAYVPPGTPAEVLEWFALSLDKTVDELTPADLLRLTPEIVARLRLLAKT